MSTRHVPIIAATLWIAVTLGTPVRAATITSSYSSGHRDVVVNGYGVDGLGLFDLTTTSGTVRAWCLEADVPHSTVDEAYAEVARQVDDPTLDALLWIVSRLEHVDDDTAAAAAALVWYHAGARRASGALVWSDGTRGFAPITPLSPEPWDALPAFSMSHPVGIRVAGAEADGVERRVADLARTASARRGPWTLTVGTAPGEFAVHGPSGPMVGVDVEVTVEGPGRGAESVVVRTDDDGTVRTALPVLPEGGLVSARVESPGIHREWDGPDATQRMATAVTAVLTASTEITAPPTTVTSVVETTVTPVVETTEPPPDGTVPVDEPDAAPTTTADTTTTSTTTTSTTTTSTTTTIGATTTTETPGTTTTSTTSVPPVPVRTPPTLPRTGTEDLAASVLRVGDLVFVLGVGLVALAGTLPRRRTADPDSSS